MRIVGSVSPDQVPPDMPARPHPRGTYKALLQRVMRDHDRGMVTVVEAYDADELKIIRKGVFDALRRQPDKLRLVSSTSETARHELRLYLSLEANGSH